MAFFEIAIEPSAIQSMRDLQLVLSYVGFGKGRLIADFPHAGPDKERKEENWIWHVHQSVKRAQGNTATLVRELLINERKKILRTRRSYNHEIHWLDNARSEHRLRAFGAIVAEQQPAGEWECCLDDFSSDRCPECLREDQHVIPLPKTADAFADALVPMLVCAKELRFVDPYFLKRNADGKLIASPKHGRVVQEIAGRLEKIKRVPQLVEFHLLKVDGVETPGEHLKAFACEMEGYLPKSWKSRAFLWTEKLGGRRFHARYVLTDVGGTGSDYGLDQGNSPSDETDLYLLPDPVRTQRIKDFSATSDAFSLSGGPIDFTGIRG